MARLTSARLKIRRFVFVVKSQEVPFLSCPLLSAVLDLQPAIMILLVGAI